MGNLVRSSDVGELQPYVPRGRDPVHHRSDEGIDPRRLVMILLHRKWQVLGVAALVVLPAMVATLMAQKLYLSAALVQIDPNPIQVLPYRDLDQQRVTHYDTFMKTQEQIFAGPTLVNQVAERLAVSKDPALEAEVDALHARLEVARVPTTEVFRVSYMAPSPEVAAAVANAFAEEYINLEFKLREQTRTQAMELLQRELATTERRIQESEKELVAYAQAHNIRRAGPTGDLADQRLSTLSSQVTDAETVIAAARARVESLEAASIADFPEGLMNDVVRNRTNALLALEHDLTGLRASYGENWPAVVQKRNEIELVREQLDREKTAVLAQAREQARLDLRAAQRKRQMLASSKTRQEGTVSQLQEASIQYNILQRNVDAHRKLYEGLLERLRQTSVDPGMTLGRIRIVEPALPDPTVASPRLWWNLFLASVLGLALGVVVALSHDFWSNSLSTVEDVEHMTLMPVLAAIPLAGSRQKTITLRSVAGRVSAVAGKVSALPAWLGGGRAEDERGAAALERVNGSAGDDRVDLAEHPETAEAVRTLCASILLSRSERPPRVLAVTSTLPGEGKTTLANELGRALAESGARTLLIECDMRRSTFEDKYGVGPEGGLSLYLSGHVKRAKIHTTSIDKLFVISAGPVAPNPVALLNSERMTTFLREMASSFHFVIMDTPPVLPMADARVLGAKADGVVLVVRARRTPKRLLQRVYSILDASGATVLGAVLNGVDARDTLSSYYGYYEHYKAT